MDESRLGSLQEIAVPQGRLRYRDVGSGPPLFFVHGLLTNSLVWHKVVPRLANEFRCITPDLPFGGHELPLPEDADLSLPGLARLVADMLDALELEDVTLVGITAGGAVCQLLVSDRPDRVGRLVLLPSEAYDNVPPRLLRYLKWSARVPGGTRALMQSTRLRFTLRGPIAWGWTAKRFWERDVLDAFLTPARADRRITRDLVKVLGGMDPRDTEAAAKRLGEFDRPALIVWSRDDRLLPFEHGERLARALPNARLEEVPDSYTYVVQDQPERVAALIREFVARTAVADGDPSLAEIKHTEAADAQPR
jgi:pimeloyl-ACP methyl ester carboxylesterase